MNRTQAIQSAKNLRVKKVVYVLPEGSVDGARVYDRKEYETIGEAKRAMRAIGCGIALLPGEKLPQ